MADLQGIRGYYKARTNDLMLFSKYGTPWDFVSGAVIIEWLANLMQPTPYFPPPMTQRPYFVDLITAFLPNYKAFEFATKLMDLDDNSKTTGFYLPLQLYLSLRNPLVHSFSLIPTGKSHTYIPPAQTTKYHELGRPGCLVLKHRASGQVRGDGEHLALVEPDRCLLRSPDFIEDIDKLIDASFDAAQRNEELTTRVLERFNQRRPVDSIGEVKIIRKGS